MLSFELLTGAAGLALGLGSYLLKSHRALSLTAAAGVVAWALHYALKDAWTACALSALAAVRLGFAVWVVQQRPRQRLRWTLGACVIAGLVAWATWQGAGSVLPLAATLLLTCAGFNARYERLRPYLAAGEVLWLLNGWYVGSLFVMAAAGMGLVFNAWGMLSDRADRKMRSEAAAARA